MECSNKTCLVPVTNIMSFSYQWWRYFENAWVNFLSVKFFPHSTYIAHIGTPVCQKPALFENDLLWCDRNISWNVAFEFVLCKLSIKVCYKHSYCINLSIKVCTWIVPSTRVVYKLSIGMLQVLKFSCQSHGMLQSCCKNCQTIYTDVQELILFTSCQSKCPHGMLQAPMLYMVQGVNQANTYMECLRTHLGDSCQVKCLRCKRPCCLKAANDTWHV